METLDATIINTAIPVIARDLLANPLDLKITLIAYWLSLAIFMPASGWLADRFGMKHVFISGIFIFTLSSLSCGFAHHLSSLVVSRTFQGIGGAFIVPVGRLIVLRTFALHEFVDAMNKVIMVVALGFIMGPILGGFITHYVSWQWIFWINIPVGLFTMLMASYFLKPPSLQAAPPFDFLGFIFLGSCIGGFIFAFSALSETALSNKQPAWMIMFASLLLLLAFFYHAKKRGSSLIKVELFFSRIFLIAIQGSLLSQLGFGSVLFLFPLLAQIGLGYSSQASGLLLAPAAIGFIAARPVASLLLRYSGFKRLLILNTLLVSSSLWTFMFITKDTSISMIVLSLFLFGFLISIQYSAMNSLAYVEISEDNISYAASIVSTIQQLAQSLGVATTTLFIQMFASSVPKNLLTMNVFHHTFLTMGIITLISTLNFMRLKSNDGLSLLITPK